MKSILNELNCVSEVQLAHIKRPKTFKDCQKKIIRIANFIFENFKDKGSSHSFNFREKYFEQTNIFKLINVYGFGNCIHSSMLFSFLMDLLKIKNEMIFLKYEKSYTHVSNKIYLEGKAYWVDTSYGIFEENKKLILYDDLKKIITKSKILEENFKKKYINNLKLFLYEKKILYRYNYIKKFYLKSLQNQKSFNLFIEKFKYKKYMKNFYSKNYFYQQALFFIDKSNKISNKKNSFGFMDGKLLNNKKFCFLNKIIFFPKINDKEFIVNNFPFPITDIKINTIKKSKLKIYIHNDIINADDSFSYFDHFSKKKKVDPVYSFKIQSNSIIKNIKLQFLISDFRLELNSLLKNL